MRWRGRTGEPGERFRQVLDQLCSEASPLAPGSFAQRKRAKFCRGYFWHSACPAPLAQCCTPPETQRAAGGEEKGLRFPRGEALGDTIRKQHEGTDKTVLVLYLTTPDHPARRNKVISSPASAVPPALPFPSLDST